MSSNSLDDMPTWWERSWDAEYSEKTHRALRKYLTLVSAYHDAVKEGSLDNNAEDSWRREIQAVRDDVEETQRGPRDYFEEVFFHLDRYDPETVRVGLERYERFLAELPVDFIDPAFVRHRRKEFTGERDREGRGLTEDRPVEPPLIQQRRFLERAISEMKHWLASRPQASGEAPTQPPPTEADIIANEIRAQVGIEARLRELCEEDVGKYPDQEDIIRRSYRKAIDALRERQ